MSSKIGLLVGARDTKILKKKKKKKTGINKNSVIDLVSLVHSIYQFENNFFKFNFQK